MKRRAKIAAYLMMLIGVGMALALMAHYGFEAVGEAFTAGGWAILLICLWRFIPLFCDAQGWVQLFGGTWRPSWLRSLWYRWIGEGVNTLLPVGQLGGDVVRARLAIKAGAGGAMAGATSIFDIILGLAAQCTLVMVAIGLVLTKHDMNDATVALSLTAVALVGGVFVLYWLPRMGLVTFLVRAATSWSDNPTVQMVNGRAARVQAAIMDLYGRRKDLLFGYFWRVAGCTLRVFETWFALKILGHDVGFEDAFVIESLINIVRTMSFAIPGGLGVQEGGLVLFGAIVGISPEVALALAVVKRMREAVIGLPAVLGWTIMEANGLRNLLPRRAPQPAETLGAPIATPLSLDAARREAAE